MANSNGEISYPVSIDDVQNVLGQLGDGDLGTLCQSSAINRWAKYKPVRKNLIDTTDQLDTYKSWKSTATWWQDNDGKCGLDYRTYSSVASVKSAISTMMPQWTRIAPTGGIVSPYRLLDFNSYHHNALSPVYAIAASNARLTDGAILTISVATSPDDGYSIRFSDIPALNSYYYTVAIYDINDQLVLLHSGDNTLSQYEDGSIIDINIPYNNGLYGYEGKLTEGRTYTVYAFLSSDPYICQISEFSGSHTYVALPCGEDEYGLQPTTFLCTRSSQWANIDAFATDRIVEWTLYLYGAGQPSGAVIRLVDLQGNVISGQSHTVDWTDAEQVSSQGTTGWKVGSTLHTTLLMPTNNPELYMVEFVTLNITARAIIGYNVDPQI